MFQGLLCRFQVPQTVLSVSEDQIALPNKSEDQIALPNDLEGHPDHMAVNMTIESAAGKSSLEYFNPISLILFYVNTCHINNCRGLTKWNISSLSLLQWTDQTPEVMAFESRIDSCKMVKSFFTWFLSSNFINIGFPPPLTSPINVVFFGK